MCKAYSRKPEKMCKMHLEKLEKMCLWGEINVFLKLK